MNKERIDLEREVLVRIFQLSNKLQVFLDNQLKNEQLTAKQLLLMVAIGSFENDPGFSEISTRFGSSRQNVKQLALKLKKNGYVQIYTDIHDARYKRVKLTNQAKEYWRKRDESDLMFLNEMFKVVSDENMIILQESMMKIDNTIDLLNKNEENGNENDS
ncbi:MAG: MarR family winged helix-turn-helix transcriptional regulator [Bacillota bacterium]|nr:MarR family winged helix-turn-helix transcriptional regulator [Bacillota bacterium]